MSDEQNSVPEKRRQRAPSQPPAGTAPFQDGGQSIADTIYHELHNDIASMKLPPRTSISEKQVAADKGVSRTPVREAILRLTRERLVEVVPKSGTFVARISLAALQESIIVRRALEAITVRGAANNATPDQVQELREILEKQKTVSTPSDIQDFHRTDEEFHAKLASIGNFQGIWDLVRQVKVQVDRYRHLTLPQEGRLPLVIDEHAAVIDAIEAGDPDTAVAKMADHLNKLHLDIAVFRDLHPDYFIHDKDID